MRDSYQPISIACTLWMQLLSCGYTKREGKQMTVITTKTEAMERLAAYAEAHDAIYNGIDRIKDEVTNFTVSESPVGWIVQVEYSDSDSPTYTARRP